MATATPAPRQPSQPPAKPAGKVVGYEQFIEQQIKKTRQHVKWADICGTLMTLAGGTLLYLLAVALMDHWLFREGLGFWGRLFALVALLGGAGTYVAMYLLPLLLKRINPVYAAQTIEQARPTLKNTLVNFLLLRHSREGVSQAVYQAVEQQAAAKLSQVHVESAVDRTRLIKISGIVLAIVAVCCLYTLLSPKNPLKTLRRVMLPWADIAAPTRVVIDEVSPGDTSTFHEGSVEVRALIRGGRDSDPVTLYYSTADGQLVDQAIPLVKGTDEFRHRGVLPAGSGGLRQDVDYYVVAGDARSRVFHVEVRPAPTIAIDRVEYVYPKYTGLEPYVSKHGDLKAIEGTRAILHATSNQKIKNAWLDLDCKGARNKTLTVAAEREASVKQPLRLGPDHQTPEFTSYQIRFANDEGHENPQPIRHSVEVVRDQPPEVKIVTPEQPQVEVPLNGKLEWKVTAKDADFALARVELVAERSDRSGDVLLAEPLLSKEHEGDFEGKYVLDPTALKLKVGDVIRVWAEARDNRQPDDDRPPEPNRSETAKYRVTITQPEKPQPKAEDVAKNEPPKKPPQDDPRNQQQQKNQQQDNQNKQGKPNQQQQQQPNQQNQQNQEKGQEGQQGQPNGPQQKQENQQQGQGGQKGAAQPSKDGQGEKGEPQEGQQNQPGEKGAQQEQRRTDPMSNPGDAFDKVLERLKEQKNKEQQQNQQQQQGNERQPAEQQNQPNKDGMPPQGQKPQQGKPNEQPEQQPQQQPGEGGQDASKPMPNQNQKPMPGQQGGGGQDQNSQQQGGENSRSGEGQQSSQDQKGQQTGNSTQKPAGTGQGGQQEQNAQKPVQGEQQRPDEPKPSEKPMQGEKAEGSAAKSGDNAAPQSPEQTRPAQGQGSEVKGQGDPKQKDEHRTPDQNPDTKGGDRDNEKGSGGAGQKTDNKPSPSTQEKNQDRGEKKQRSPEAEDREGQQENGKSPSNSNKQSDSKGGAEGDRSGGGKSGGGQTASGTQGTGGPGQSTASDQGQNKAPGSGEGETGEKAGNKVESEKPTGNADPQGRKGDGSQQKPGGSQAGGEKSQDPKTPPGQQPKQDQDSKSPPGPGNSQDGAGQPGGQKASDRPSGQQTPSGTGEVPPGEQQPGKPQPPAGEDPNLDYARKATDLALEHLKDQLAKEKPDQELLDKLKWTPEDLRRFVDHWEQMKRQAAQPGKVGADAKKKLDESLKGLGLQPRGTQVERNAGNDDTSRNLRSSRRSAPPAEYAEQVKAYKQRLSKGQSEK